MAYLYKKILFASLFNFTLFLILMIGIQNSSEQKKVNLIINETISLPIGFIVGVSFISGSITGTLLSLNLKARKELTF